MNGKRQSTSIAENKGNVIIGDNNNIFICYCNAGCTSDVTTRKIAGPLQERQAYQTNKLCSCSKKEENEMGSLLDMVTDIIHEKNCPNFELHLYLKNDDAKIVEQLIKGERFICKFCHANSTGRHSLVESGTCSPSEFEVKLLYPNQSSLKINNSILVTDANTLSRMKTSKLTQLQQLTSVTNKHCIQVRTKVDENGTKIRFKFLVDVKRSAQRRCYSCSEIEKRKHLLKTNEKSNSLKRPSMSTKSNISLSAAKSFISIDEMLMDVTDLTTTLDKAANKCHDHTEVDAPPPDASVTTLCSIQSEDLQGEPKSNTGSNANNDLEATLKDKVPFANGKFGPLYKVTKKGQEMILKVVGDNPNFLEEAKQFFNCTHPFVRPTADISVNGKRSYVMYRFVDGKTLYEAIQNGAIHDYIIYFRILYGIVKGLCYLREKQIDCQFLTTEKVILDINFNPRICGAGLAYFDKPLCEGTNVEDFRRTLSYLDQPLRSCPVRSPKNVVWSVGRIIWEMLFGKISRNHVEDLLDKYHIFEHLSELCDDKIIKARYFSPELRKIVYAAGWPKDKEITKALVVCAFRCMLINLDERMSLSELYNALQTALCELQKKEKFSLYRVLPDNRCIFCLENERGCLALTCGCTTACYECLKNVGALYCPEHGFQYSKIGHPFTYGVIIEGDFPKEQNIFANDANAMEQLCTDQDTFGIKIFDRIKSTTESVACRELENVKDKIIEHSKNGKRNGRYPSTLFLLIIGHCNEAGNVILSDKSILKKKNICNFIRDLNVKNVIVLCNGHYSEKLIKNLSRVKSNFLNPIMVYSFYGVFSHAGNLCSMSLKNVCEKHSVIMKCILDILKEGKPSVSQSYSISRKHLTIRDLIQLVSERMSAKCGRSLKPIERNGAGHIPVVYL